MDLQTEVLIIGGGATGAGISRDLALRGIPSLLVEKDDFTSGASGRNQGLLHSGARYAVNDPEAARECITENRILRRIAPHCIEDTGGLFVSLPEDGPEYRATFIRACGEAGIDTLPLSPREALSMEPKLNPSAHRRRPGPRRGDRSLHARRGKRPGCRIPRGAVSPPHRSHWPHPRRPPDRRGAGERPDHRRRNLRLRLPG